MRVQQGFTLIELMVTVAVLGIVIGFAVPGFQSVVNGNRLAGAANELIATMQVARMEAIRRNRRVAVCASANGSVNGAVMPASTSVRRVSMTSPLKGWPPAYISFPSNARQRRATAGGRRLYGPRIILVGISSREKS